MLVGVMILPYYIYIYTYTYYMYIYIYIYIMYSLKALAPKLGGFNAMRISAPLILNLSRNNGLALDLFILVMLVIFRISRMGLLLSC